MYPCVCFFPGHSEMAGRMRAYDGSVTDPGSPQSWPVNLRTAVSLCLTSRFPILVWWGPNLWDTIALMLTFTFGPILSRDGHSVQRVFCPCTETTDKLLGARRLETLRKHGVQALENQTIVLARVVTAKALEENLYYIPFAAICLVDDSGTAAVLKSAIGFSDEIHPFQPRFGQLPAIPSPWPLASVQFILGPGTRKLHSREINIESEEGRGTSYRRARGISNLSCYVQGKFDR